MDQTWFVLRSRDNSLVQEYERLVWIEQCDDTSLRIAFGDDADHKVSSDYIFLIVRPWTIM